MPARELFHNDRLLAPPSRSEIAAAPAAWTRENFPQPQPTMRVLRGGDCLAEGEDGFSIGDIKNSLRVERHPGVSNQFAKRIEDWVSTVPSNLQKLAKDHGVSIAIYPSAAQLPKDIVESHARRHPGDETVGHLPTFYNSGSKRIIFIEKPNLTRHEQVAQNNFDRGEDHRKSHGVQSFGAAASFDAKSLSYAPIERNAWHEFGHALDLAAFNFYSSKDDKFQAAFAQGRAGLSPRDAQLVYYFAKGENAYPGHEFDAAKQELFAELFAIGHIAPTKRTERDRVLLNHFDGVLKLLRRDKPEVFSRL